MHILQRLYDSEINGGVSTFWDGGFDVWLGDDMNGRVSETSVRTMAEAERWLFAAALRLYPDSRFARSVATSPALQDGDHPV